MSSDFNFTVILIPRKFPHKTHFNRQWGAGGGADYAPGFLDPPTALLMCWAKQRGTVEEDLLLQIWAMQKT